MLKSFQRLLMQHHKALVGPQVDHRLLRRHAQFVQQPGDVRARQMHPVNGPGRAQLRPIGVQQARGNHQQAPCLNCVAGTRQFAPPCSLSAINQDGLGHALRPLDTMAGGPWIIANISWKQAAEQRVSQPPPHHPTRQHHDALAGKAFRLLLLLHGAIAYIIAKKLSTGVALELSTSPYSPQKFFFPAPCCHSPWG